MATDERTSPENQAKLQKKQGAIGNDAGPRQDAPGTTAINQQE
ncbi:hypothetical protein [Burkholderia anthina]|nr:hypothetical protein [Burkholderia anthina]